MKTVLGIGLTARPGKADCSGLNEILDGLETQAISHVELSTYDNDLVIGGRIHRGNLARLKAACAGRRLGYSVHGPLGINFFDEPFRLDRHFEVFKASMEIAAEVGAVHYVLHSGLARTHQAAGIEACYGRQREWLVRCAEIGAAHGIHVCVENLFTEWDGSTYASNPSRLARELAAIDHPFLRATLDVSHAYLLAGFRGLDFLAEIAALAPFAKHVHMHDSFGRADDIWMYAQGERVAFGHGDLHLPVGWGSIPWDDVTRVCDFPDLALFNIELNERYFYAVEECVSATRAVADRVGRIEIGAVARNAAE
ncbi:MAG: sugar phosphate isomerase/epimerase family protein [Labrys sp. (in: a-proteobacteria)]